MDHDEARIQPFEQQQQLQQGVSSSSEELFSQGIADLFMAVEELRQQQSVSRAAAVVHAEDVIQWQRALDYMMQILCSLQRWCDDIVAANTATGGDTNTTTIDILQHAIQKVVTIAQKVLEACCTKYSEQQQQQLNEDSTRSHSSSHADSEAAAAAAMEARRDGQAAIARITELNLIFRSMLNASSNEKDNGSILNHEKIIELYVQFQRQTLRQRAKPAIAALVQERRQGTFQQQQNDRNEQPDNAAVPVQGGMVVHHDDDNEHLSTPQQQHHAPVITVILGEAAALIHPLAAWRIAASNNNNVNDTDSIQKLCHDSIHTLDDQAQSLAKIVSDWFWQDRPVEHWMQTSCARHTNTTTDKNKILDESTLATLDALVEEMAYTCQVFERYQTLMDSIDISSSSSSSSPTETTTTETETAVIAKELLPEWTWKYGALERFLALQFWQAALSHAVPVTIVLGTSIRVPSVVEDAQYLSTRALQRAATTKSRQAIATVAYAVSHDVWSTEVVVSSSSTAESSTSSTAAASAVYQALLDQMGCWSDEHEPEHDKKEKKKGSTNGGLLSSPPQSGGGFASALLDALDDDEKGQKQKSPPTAKAAPPPLSGNFLTALVTDKEKMQQIELDTLFCLLNGMHAASGASRALVTFLDDLLLESDDDDDENSAEAVLPADEKATSMIQLAREELSGYADTYQKLLTDRIEETLDKFCGSSSSSKSLSSSRSTIKHQCFRDLELFLERENYNLNGDTITAAEADERLEKELLGPLRQSKFLQQLRHKCESEVLQITAERIATVVVDIILSVLWQKGSDGDSTKKVFTDWGSLLISKQVRMLQSYISTTMINPMTGNTADVPPAAHATTALVAAKLLQIWERLSQVVTVLQLEKPSDWLAYHSTSVLSPDELSRTLSLRVDFSADAIQSVVSSVTPAPSSQTQETEAATAAPGN